MIGSLRAIALYLITITAWVAIFVRALMINDVPFSVWLAMLLMGMAQSLVGEFRWYRRNRELLTTHRKLARIARDLIAFPPTVYSLAQGRAAALVTIQRARWPWRLVTTRIRVMRYDSISQHATPNVIWEFSALGDVATRTAPKGERRTATAFEAAYLADQLRHSTVIFS
jgi:hypothetical protein